MNGLALQIAAATVAAPPSGPLEKSWHSPQELLPLLAVRDDVRWAMPETLAGRAWVGGDLTREAALDEACKQWGFAWTEVNGVVVVHRADDARLKRWTKALQDGGRDAVTAVWELGWLGDARALPPLAEALAGKDVAVSLAAAQALETLLADVPLGRDERVDVVLPGRVSLAAAFPATVDLLPLLESPYPAVRAAALRVLLGQGGKAADQAKTATVRDRAVGVLRVRQQLLFTPGAQKEPRKKTALPPPPKDREELKAACKKVLEDLPKLEKQSAWEVMCTHAETLAAWSRAGHDDATDTFLEMTGTKVQQNWYPGYVQRWLATSGGDRVRAKIKELMPKADRLSSQAKPDNTCPGPIPAR